MLSNTGRKDEHHVGNRWKKFGEKKYERLKEVKIRFKLKYRYSHFLQTKTNWQRESGM